MRNAVSCSIRTGAPCRSLRATQRMRKWSTNFHQNTVVGCKTTPTRKLVLVVVVPVVAATMPKAFRRKAAHTVLALHQYHDNKARQGTPMVRSTESVDDIDLYRYLDAPYFGVYRVDCLRCGELRDLLHPASFFHYGHCRQLISLLSAVSLSMPRCSIPARPRMRSDLSIATTCLKDDKIHAATAQQTAREQSSRCEEVVAIKRDKFGLLQWTAQGHLRLE